MPPNIRGPFAPEYMDVRMRIRSMDGAYLTVLIRRNRFRLAHMDVALQLTGAHFPFAGAKFDTPAMQMQSLLP